MQDFFWKQKVVQLVRKWEEDANLFYLIWWKFDRGCFLWLILGYFDPFLIIFLKSENFWSKLFGFKTLNRSIKKKKFSLFLTLSFFWKKINFQIWIDLLRLIYRKLTWIFKNKNVFLKFSIILSKKIQFLTIKPSKIKTKNKHSK